MDPQIEKKRLFEAVPIEEDVLAAATHEMREARRKLGLGPSIITSIVVSMCHFVFTRTIDTFAVKLTGDGNPMLMVNPDFIIKIGAKQAVFALTHEAYHLLMVHLYTDPHLHANPNWTTATEACINYRITKHLKHELIKVDGEVGIVDPAKVYDSYRNAMNKIGQPPVSREQFFETDMGCFAHLEQLPKPIKAKNAQSCVHASDAGSESGDPSAPIDQSEAGKFMDKVLAGAIQAAKNGRDGAKDEILSVMDASPEAAETWGDLGAGSLRGETIKSTKSQVWVQWTADKIASRMADGNKWRYNTKVPWDPRVSASGKQPKKHGAVFIDASGSMSQRVLDQIAALIGELEEIDITWFSFDGAIWPFEAGEPFLGGGGTSFHIIEDWYNGGDGGNPSVQGNEDDLDFVLVVTDGYAPELDPSDPDKWVWLIVPGGTTWPANHGMDCMEIDLDD